MIRNFTPLIIETGLKPTKRNLLSEKMFLINDDFGKFQFCIKNELLLH